MDMSMVTIQDCIDMMQYKNKAVILNDGVVMGFHEEGEIQE